VTEHSNIVRAFTEEHVERLTGLSKSQLRYWDRTGFFAPSFADEGRGRGGRIYSFHDVVGLRTLGILRKDHRVPLQNLRRVAEKLSHMKRDLWTKQVLYVQDKRVQIIEEETDLVIDPVSGQYANGLALQAVMADVDQMSAHLQQRLPSQIGQISQHRFVVHNATVIAGTRVPTAAIKQFHDAGYGVDEIMREYPGLTEADIRAALSHEEHTAA
jgi:DNA-binding transcriptional MerR regulator